ncbi:fatty acid desaturase family protein [Streptomyces poonensis]|uniref:Fatty acid desaturase n=1 Tax=Streptomyces poonensis TaxID=68255 RepID=A0A918Q2E5_9ACTN|nr:acyl-CoA desaturase [Streptomyces poonensis]GGZ28392.1 fatty acid desaturase [Streptomyces poonensis]GLJ89828.1 fatty acid desaturase [Streptomyces poonensis]
MSTAIVQLSDSDIEAFGAELDRIREDVLAERGESDARYIRRLIAVRRGLEAGGRAALAVSLLPPAWAAGTAMLAAARILDNAEIGHSVLHGQWDWMRDPRIHSTTWKWDLLASEAAWQRGHNDNHHVWTNVVGKDRDFGVMILRLSHEQAWRPYHLAQPLYFALLSPFFDWVLAVYELEFDAVREGRKSVGAYLQDTGALLARAARRAAREYVLFPLLSGPSALPCLLGNVSADLIRNVWIQSVIFVGHFHTDVETFTEEQAADETHGDWYVRQLLGTANFEGPPWLHIASGTLSHQIEHHLFPDLPNNRLPQIASRVRALCEKYRLPYTTGSLVGQCVSSWKRIFRYALPTRDPRGGEVRQKQDDARAA